MPELPDIAILTDAFQAALAGRPIVASEAPADARRARHARRAGGARRARSSQSVTRRGKFIVLQLERDRIIVNAMLTGRLGLGAPGVEGAGLDRLDAALRRARRGARSRRRPGRAARRGCRRTAMPSRAALPRPDADGQDLPGARRRRPGRSPAGTSWGRTPTTRRSTWRPGAPASSAIAASSRTCCASSRSWPASATATATRSSGRPAGAVPQALDAGPEEVDALYEATRATLAWAIDELRRRVPPRFEVEVRDFLHVHRKGGQACPRCGTTISEIAPGGFVTSFCRGCQR